MELYNKHYYRFWWCDDWNAPEPSQGPLPRRFCVSRTAWCALGQVVAQGCGRYLKLWSPISLRLWNCLFGCMIHDMNIKYHIIFFGGTVSNVGFFIGWHVWTKAPGLHWNLTVDLMEAGFFLGLMKVTGSPLGYTLELREVKYVGWFLSYFLFGDDKQGWKQLERISVFQYIDIHWRFMRIKQGASIPEFRDYWQLLGGVNIWVTSVQQKDPDFSNAASLTGTWPPVSIPLWGRWHLGTLVCIQNVGGYLWWWIWSG